MFRPNQNHSLALHSSSIEPTDFVFKTNSHVLENVDLVNSIFHNKTTQTSGWCNWYLGWNKIIDRLHLVFLHVTISDFVFRTKLNTGWDTLIQSILFHVIRIINFRGDLTDLPARIKKRWSPWKCSTDTHEANVWHVTLSYHPRSRCNCYTNPVGGLHTWHVGLLFASRCCNVKQLWNAIVTSAVYAQLAVLSFWLTYVDV